MTQTECRVANELKRKEVHQFYKKVPFLKNCLWLLLYKPEFHEGLCLAHIPSIEGLWGSSNAHSQNTQIILQIISLFFIISHEKLWTINSQWSPHALVLISLQSKSKLSIKVLSQHADLADLSNQEQPKIFDKKQ